MARLPIIVETDNAEKVNMYPNAKCTICGSDHPSAMWRGDEDIFVCHRCAINILPRLMADALMARPGSYEQFLNEARTAKAAFYQAAHCAAMH